jgi:hypothetical protein
MAGEKLHLEGLTEVPVRQLSKFLKIIAELNLWSELEQHLSSRGCETLLISFEPVKAIGAIAESRARERFGGQPDDVSKLARCGCNGPMSPGTSPTTPSGGGGDAGAGDGGVRPRWLAVRVDSFVEQVEGSVNAA